MLPDMSSGSKLRTCEKPTKNVSLSTLALLYMRSTHGMSLQIYIAHTGQCLSPALRFSTLESLQSWIARNSTIESQDQILMTARGKQVKLQTLSLETEIFVYNRQILSASTQASLSSSLPSTPVPDPYSPEAVPQGPRNKDDLEAWQKLFNERKAWAIQLQDRCTAVTKQIQQFDSEANVIQRSAAIAVENVKQHIANLRPKFEDSSIWAENVLQDQSFLLEEWERIVGKYPSIPTIKALGTCLSGTSTDASSRSSTSETETSLYDFVDIAEATKASNAGKGAINASEAALVMSTLPFPMSNKRLTLLLRTSTVMPISLTAAPPSKAIICWRRPML